jgi:hypothetical protein
MQIKYIAINITTDVKEFYNENYKALRKENVEDIRRWKDLTCSWIGRKKYCQNGHIAKRVIQIQCNPYQKANDILQRNTKKKKSKTLHRNTKDPE